MKFLLDTDICIYAFKQHRVGSESPALSEPLVLISNNRREFGRVAGLYIESWTTCSPREVVRIPPRKRRSMLAAITWAAKLKDAPWHRQSEATILPMIFQTSRRTRKRKRSSWRRNDCSDQARQRSARRSWHRLEKFRDGNPGERSTTRNHGNP